MDPAEPTPRAKLPAFCLTLAAKAFWLPRAARNVAASSGSTCPLGLLKGRRAVPNLVACMDVVLDGKLQARRISSAPRYVLSNRHPHNA
jgi:hypothetical protein